METNRIPYHFPAIRTVSEGLSSVETYKITINRKGIGKFQKNLVVWKPFVLTEPVWMPSRFQKNLVVWKLDIREWNYYRMGQVSEELSSVETHLPKLHKPVLRYSFRRT